MVQMTREKKRAKIGGENKRLAEIERRMKAVMRSMPKILIPAYACIRDSKDLKGVASHMRCPCAQTIITCIFREMKSMDWFPHIEIELTFDAAERRIHLLYIIIA